MLRAFGKLAAITAVFTVVLVATTPDLLPFGRYPVHVVAGGHGTWFAMFGSSAIIAGIAALATRRPNAALVAGGVVAAALTALNLVGRQI